MLGMFCNSRIPALYTNLLGENINILSGISLPRRQTPGIGNPPVPFHQDAGFMGNPGLVINSWIPLNQAGFKAPGLQLVLSPQTNLLIPPGYLGKNASTYEELDLSENFITQKFSPNLLWAPILEPGDVLFFSHLTIHRTFITSEMNSTRISLEIRCMGQSS
jgi:hypothetical protein